MLFFEYSDQTVSVPPCNYYIGELDGKFLFGQLAVFALCGFAAAYMALLLILFQYALDFFIESFVGFLELYRNVLMNGAFAYSELLCG